MLSQDLNLKAMLDLGIVLTTAEHMTERGGLLNK